MNEKTNLEKEFGLPAIQDVLHDDHPEPEQPELAQQQQVTEAMDISEKINHALRQVQGMETHDSEMDEIAREALDSYKDLMSVGMNLTDMASGPVFSSATQMLKVALEARDSKVNRKLKQLDLMLKKASLDHRTSKNSSGTETESISATVLDRNQLLKLLGQHNTEE